MEANIVPLYAARVSDLKTGDLVLVECACGHSMTLPPSSLSDGLRLSADFKIVDLAPRLRCCECNKRGRAVVSIRWASVVALAKADGSSWRLAMAELVYKRRPLPGEAIG